MEWLIDASAWVLPAILAITMHEAAHGWMAERFGDPTARNLGRVTFNPLKHVDRVGTLLIPGALLLAHSPVMFGYAKPVPVNFGQLKPERLGLVMVALAGPGANILLALITGLLLHVENFITPEQSPWLFLNLYRSIVFNCVLAIFNLIPILPLDGGRIVDSLLPGRARSAYRKTERYGVFIIIGLLILPVMLGNSAMQDIIREPVFWLLHQILWLTGNGE